ncbi:MAG: 1-acyl-sn-glycerol-3-phosphate acyltransferase [Candidatus Omnitrophica bacterium]|nr:1-acyl-sn-glycerol-3-phosphate acyltransferase [Candidatus Omnitrophota bacterium]
MGQCIYHLCRCVFFVILRLFFRLEIKGSQNIPLQGPAILVAKHSSLLDPFIITCSTRRIIHWLVAGWVFRIRPFRFLARRIPFLKVEPGKTNNKEALKKAIEILSQGGIIGVFPEGRLSKTSELNPFLSGTVYLGIRSKSAIIPLYIDGAYQIMQNSKFLKFSKVCVIIGKSFYLNGLYNLADKETVKKISAVIREKILELKGG